MKPIFYPPEQVATAIELMKAGVFMPAIAKQTGIPRSALYHIAKRAKVQYVKQRPARNCKRIGESKTATVKIEGTNYRALASHYRWNKLGGSIL